MKTTIHNESRINFLVSRGYYRAGLYELEPQAVDDLFDKVVNEMRINSGEWVKQ